MRAAHEERIRPGSSRSGDPQGGRCAQSGGAGTIFPSWQKNAEFWGTTTLLIRRSALGPQQRDRGHGPSSDKGRAGSIQLEMGEPRFISQDAQKTMRQTLLWVVLTSESNSKSA